MSGSWSEGERPAGERAAVEKLRREDWYVESTTQAAATSAVEAWHYAQGCPNTSVARHGLYPIESHDLLGVAMWLPPTPTAARSAARFFGREDDWRGVLSLTRLVIAPDVPTNGASFLLGASMRLIDRARWPILLTYADTALGHTGAIYKATNWVEVGEVPAGDTWVGPDGEQRGRKRGKRNLSVAEMRSLGFERRPAAPKVKFVHVEPRHAHGVDPGQRHEGVDNGILSDVVLAGVQVDGEVGHGATVRARCDVLPPCGQLDFDLARTARGTE